MTLQTAGPRYRVLEPSVPLAPYTADPDHATRFAERVAKAARAGRVLGASELCGLWHQAGASGSHTDRRPADEAARSHLTSSEARPLGVLGARRDTARARSNCGEDTKSKSCRTFPYGIRR